MSSLLSSLGAAVTLLVAAKSVLAYDAEVCGEEGYHSKGDRYAFYPNAWAPEDGGFTCMSVNEDPPEYDVTWEWPSTPTSVNSFPHVKFQNTRIPSSIGGITSMKLKASWGIGGSRGSFPMRGIQMDDMEAVEVKCNVGWDMFAAADSDDAQTEKTATTEIMIWLANFGDNWPLGFGDGPANDEPIELGGIEYNLYDGKNGDMRVLSWAAAENVTDFDVEALPLITYLVENDFVSADDVLGLVEFGSEAFYSTSNVTFSAFNMEVKVESDDPESKYHPLVGPCAQSSNGFATCGDLNDTFTGDGTGNQGDGGSNNNGGDDEDIGVNARASFAFLIAAFVSVTATLI